MAEKLSVRSAAEQLKTQGVELPLDGLDASELVIPADQIGTMAKELLAIPAWPERTAAFHKFIGGYSVSQNAAKDALRLGTTIQAGDLKGRVAQQAEAFAGTVTANLGEIRDEGEKLFDPNAPVEDTALRAVGIAERASDMLDSAGEIDIWQHISNAIGPKWVKVLNFIGFDFPLPTPEATPAQAVVSTVAGASENVGSYILKGTLTAAGMAGAYMLLKTKWARDKFGDIPAMIGGGIMSATAIWTIGAVLSKIPNPFAKMGGLAIGGGVALFAMTGLASADEMTPDVMTKKLVEDGIGSVWPDGAFIVNEAELAKRLTTLNAADVFPVALGYVCSMPTNDSQGILNTITSISCDNSARKVTITVSPKDKTRLALLLQENSHFTDTLRAAWVNYEIVTA